MSSLEFLPWPKTSRLPGNLMVTVSDKIDGTNACIIIENGVIVGVQSRKRFITPGDDNAGFAGWVAQHTDELLQLGDGHHYGEWAGPNIQSNPHKLEKKTFFLFNTHRWAVAEDRPTIVEVVPVLYEGPFDTQIIDDLMPDRVEGVIIFFHAFRLGLKRTNKNPEGKWGA